MVNFKRKIQEKVKTQETTKNRVQDIRSAKAFKDGLTKGETEVGSLLFSGTSREEKIIRQICRYYDYVYKGKTKVLCGYPDCSNRFYVTHYNVS